MGDGKARTDYIDYLKKALDDEYKKFTRCMYITDDLQKVASLLEKETGLTWAMVDKFKDRDEIVQIVASMKKKHKSLIEQRRLDYHGASKNIAAP